MKRIFSLAVFLLVTILLSGCGNIKNSKTRIDDENTTELKMCYITFSRVPKDMDLVNAEINKITKEKINATVKIEPIISSEYSQQINLKLNSNEKLDMFVTGNIPGILDYPTLVSKGKLYSLDDVLKNKGEGITSVLGVEELNVGRIHGKIYGLPTIKDMATQHGVKIRKDLIDKYNIDISTIKTLSDLESLMKVIHQNQTGEFFGVLGGVSMVDCLGVSSFGDNLVDGFGVLMNPKKLEVVDYYETPEYAELLKTIRRWYTLGYILPNIVTNKENDSILIKENMLYGSTAYINPLSQYLETKAAEVPVSVIPIYPGIKTTSTVTNFMWSIPSYSNNSEKAMEFLNLMYTDKDIINLLDYGIEGIHYKKVDGYDEMIDEVSDVNTSESGYNLNQEYMFGNEFLAHIWNGNPHDIWKQIDSFNKSAEKSAALGFVFDQTPVKAEYAKVADIVSQYKPALENGAVDPNVVLPEFISKLKAAGIDKIVSEKQKQLDEWEKNKNTISR